MYRYKSYASNFTTQRIEFCIIYVLFLIDGMIYKLDNIIY